MRIQVDFDEQGVRTVDDIKEKTGLTTYKDVFNNALALFTWALKERSKGRLIVSLDEENRDYKELHMPALERAAAVSAADAINSAGAVAARTVQKRGAA